MFLAVTGRLLLQQGPDPPLIMMLLEKIILKAVSKFRAWRAATFHSLQLKLCKCTVQRILSSAISCC